jgi:bifunctional DNase/RNase
LVEVRVQSLGLDPSTNNPVVVLQELEGERVLLIWIGPGEASAIAMQLADMEFPRPLTHDLLVAVLKGLGGLLQKVVISRVEKSTYYAELIVHRNGEVLALDARPSDSVAVALRVGAPIFVANDLLELASVDIAEGESAPLGTPPSMPQPQEGMEGESLEEQLRKLDPEDFGRFTP